MAQKHKTLRIATWNVNSIKSRLHHVKAWLDVQKPDVLMLQELKGLDFPAAEFKALGYESAAVTQKAYNGVAILSRLPIETVSMKLAGGEEDTHARYLETTIAGLRVVNIYLPNGNPPGSPNFVYKLAWMDRFKKQLALWRKQNVPVVIGGDFNVIPEDIDCHKPSSWVGNALFEPEPRQRYRAWLNMGYTDAFRHLHPGEQAFTFWDYFRDAFAHNRGIRIDHFLLAPAVTDRLKSCMIDQSPRMLDKPSDHTPIILELG